MVDAPHEQALRLEADARLDGAVDGLEALAAPVAEGSARRVLGGEWLGHPLHPALTDLPIAFWTSAWALDLVGGSGARVASRRLIGLGILSSVPTAVTGLSDWTAMPRRAQRVGVVHAAANSVALVCFTASYLARRRGRHGQGIFWAQAGTMAATVGGFLGGHLAFSAGDDEDASGGPPGGGEEIDLTLDVAPMVAPQPEPAT